MAKKRKDQRVELHSTNCEHPLSIEYGWKKAEDALLTMHFTDESLRLAKDLFYGACGWMLDILAHMVPEQGEDVDEAAKRAGVLMTNLDEEFRKHALQRTVETLKRVEEEIEQAEPESAPKKPKKVPPTIFSPRGGTA